MEMGGRSPRAPSAPPRAPQPVAPAPVDPHLCGHCCDALDRDPGRRCDPWPAGQSQSPCSMRVEASLFRLGCLSLSPLVEAHPGNYAVHLQLHQLTSLTSTKLPAAAAPSLQAPLPCGQQHHQRPCQNHGGLYKWQRQPLFAGAASSRPGRAARRSTYTDTLHC